MTNWYVRTLAAAVLGRGRRRLRHPVHRARGATPGHGAAGAAGHRGGLARPDRRPLRAPDRLADRRRAAVADGGGRARRRPLVAAMDRVREVCSVTLGLRKANGLRVRQPLRDADRRRAGRRRARAVRRPRRRRGQRQGGRARSAWTTPRRVRPRRHARLAVNARAAGPRLGRDVQASSGRRRPATGSRRRRPRRRVTADGPVLLRRASTSWSPWWRPGTVPRSRPPCCPVAAFVVRRPRAGRRAGRARATRATSCAQVQDARKAAGLQVADRDPGWPRRCRPGWRGRPSRSTAALIAAETLADGRRRSRDGDGDAVTVAVEKDGAVA